MTDKAILERIAGALERIADAQELNLAAAERADEAEAEHRAQGQASKEQFNSLIERAFTLLTPRPMMERCPEHNGKCVHEAGHAGPHQFFLDHPPAKPQ